MEYFPKQKNQSLECMRVSGEHKFYERFIELMSHETSSVPAISIRPYEAARLEMMSKGLLLTENSAPRLHQLTKTALANLNRPNLKYDLFQVVGDDNAWTVPYESHPLITLQGRYLTTLDDMALLCVIGHELGHCFCHSESTGFSTAVIIRSILFENHEDHSVISRENLDAVKQAASAYCQCHELTADRAELLASRDLNACLRLEMINITGLSSDDMIWDYNSFLAQARAVVAQMKLIGAPISTHPNPYLRAWALAEFARTDVYKRLTGQGPGTLKIQDLNRDIDSIFEILNASEELDRDGIHIELILFSLCACVLIAWVDGVFSDSEADFLERTFSKIIPDYQKFLNIKFTYTTLNELTPYIRQCSILQKQNLFFTLYQLTVADGDICEKEIELLLLIARSIRCYDDWLKHLETLCSEGLCQCPTSDVRRSIYSKIQDTEQAPAIDELSDLNSISAYFEDLSDTLLESPADFSDEDSPRVVSNFSTGLDITHPPKRPVKQRSQTEETENAIALFCSNIQRRGSSRTTLARLLRLAGMKSSECAAAIELYRKLFPKYEIVAEPPLDEQMSLQDVIILTSTHVGDEDSIEIQTDSSVAALIRAFARLQASQVSGNGRSASVRCKAEKPGRSFDMTRLNHVVHGRTERVLESLEAEKSVVAISPTEAGHNQAGMDISRLLEELSREAKARIEEQGTSHLYVGSSFISGCINGYEICAPLMLRPVELTRMNGGVSGWTLTASKGNSAKVNHAVLRMIAGKRGSAFTEEMIEKLDEAALSGDEALTSCVEELGFFMGVRGGHRLEDAPDNRDTKDAQPDDSHVDLDESEIEAPSASTPVEEEDASVADALYPMSKRTPLPDYPTDDWLCLESCAMLGFFPQSGSETMKEYSEILSEIQSSSRPLSEIIGSLKHVLPSSMTENLMRENPQETPDSNDDERACTVEIDHTGKVELPMVSLDPSQLDALCAARTEEALVIDGPPGTGKSQVIVGIVLDALARGLKVAVVSDKRAALDVVAQRLSAHDFDDIYGIVYDVNKDRTELFSRIAARLAKSDEALQTFDSREFDLLYHQYQAMHREMNIRQDALLYADDDFSAAEYATYLAALKSQLELSVSDSETWHPYIESDHSNALFSPVFLNPDPDLMADIAAVAPRNLQSMRDTLARFIPYHEMYEQTSWWSHHHDREFLSSLPEFTEFVAGFKPYADSIQSNLKQYSEISDSSEFQALEVAADTWFQLWKNPDPSTHSPDFLVTPWSELDNCVSELQNQCGDLSRIMLNGAEFSEDKLNEFRLFTDSWKPNLNELKQILNETDYSYDPSIPSEEVIKTWHQIRSFFECHTDLNAEHTSLPWHHIFDMCVEMLASHTSFIRIFKPSYWKLQKNINLWFERYLPSAKPQKLTPESISQIRDQASLYIKVQKMLARNRCSASLGFEELAREFNSFAQKKLSLQSWCNEHQMCCESTLITTESLNETLALARQNMDIQRQLLPCVQLDHLGLDILHDELRSKSKQALELKLLQDECSSLFSCIPRIAELFFETTADAAPNQTEIWQTACCQLWAKSRLKALCEKNQTILSLCNDEPRESGDSFIDRFKRLETELIKRSRDKLREDLRQRGILSIPRPQPRARRTPEQKALESMRDEASKKTRRKTLRQYIHAFADTGLLDILPVWLLSPETMTVLFPRKPIFDLVIFDEASQATVASSLPALLRSKRWIIAGDDKQMPPSSFFASSTEIEESSHKSIPSATDVFDSESLLTLARSRAKHTRLTWHYRSQHDALIAFSNFAFYDGDLKTVPEIPRLDADNPLAPDAPERLLRWVAVEHGTYDKGRNPVEAKRVAELLFEALKLHPEESVGIITFNINQRHEIMDAIDALCRQTPEFAALYQAALELPIDRQPFVKSIENVQGDERDAIFFSLGHCAVPQKGQQLSDARVPARFGPLGLKGGERRLNVAISRAKIRSTIVASFEPHQLSVGNVRNAGPAFFKLFVEFMWASAHDDHVSRNIKLSEAQRLLQSQNTELNSAPHKSIELPGALSLAALIAHDAELAGFSVELNVGIGPFKIPLALYKKDHPPVAVLIQNEGTQNAYDATIHRPSMLINKGWRVIQTNAIEWLGMRDHVLEQL